MSTALVEWTPVDGADVPLVPGGPLLVRAAKADGGFHHYVAESLGRDLWRLVGAPERRVYGITDWARIEDAVAHET
jgi:hypothetical protein